MKNLKKISREQLKSVHGGLLAPDAGCHCHGAPPSPQHPTGLPPIDIPADGPQDCWAKCDRYRGKLVDGIDEF
ncbi:bacteriocin-like protein [Chryseobacterium gambrini]|uniref:Bacteriocin-type signal sequence-containing protein n=1 Tax=Chryseobacterium gambrini TaxID=373672 RepID=A0ABM8KAT2_9FLAO|nr:hypothetical protein [Chryseobacterium gambrini]WBX96254.1 hypothetical protein PE065_15570 [Chryseobacterium gambrini]BEV06153.1 hypothetical protein CRDW_35270 [Chryseobacterium gambrini]